MIFFLILFFFMRLVTDPLEIPTNYAYETSEIEISDGLAKLLPIVSGAEAALYVKLDENAGLVAIDSSGNDRHGAFQGGYTKNQWVPGKINSGIQGISLINGFINFDQLLSYERTQAFSLEFWVKTTSNATMTLISKQLNAGTLNGFAINMISGKLRIIIRDSSANILSLESQTIINDGSWYHVVFTYNGNSQITGLKFYIDTVQNNTIIASTPLTATITNTADLQISGRDGNNLCIDANTFMDEVVVYSRELTPAEIAFRFNGGAGTQQLPGASTAFPTNRPPIKPRVGIKAISFESFDADIIATGSDNVLFRFYINNIPYWFDGAIWDISLNNLESNTLLDIQLNILAFPITELSDLNWEAFLVSDDGSSTPELLMVSMGVDIGSPDVEKETVKIIFKPCKGDSNTSYLPTKIIPVPDVINYKNDTIVRNETLTVCVDPLTLEGSINLIETDNMSDPENGNQPYYEFHFSDTRILNRVVNSGVIEINFLDLQKP